jgi:hypothetical protein
VAGEFSPPLGGPAGRRDQHDLRALGGQGDALARPRRFRSRCCAGRWAEEVDATGLDAIGGSREPVAAQTVRLHRTVVRLLEPSWYEVAGSRRVSAP